MKNTLLAIALVAAIAASLSSCVGQKRTSAGSTKQATMNTVNDSTKIIIDTDRIDNIKLLLADDGSYEASMLRTDYAAFASFLSGAVYDTARNDKGIMFKMVTPDYTAIISYEDLPADENDWLMVWKENGLASFRQKWFLIPEDGREGLYRLMEKYGWENSILMTVFPERNGGAPDNLELTIKNNTDYVIQFGANYSIESLENGLWEEVDLGNFAVIAIMYGIQPGESGNYRINLFTDRINYPEGDYRVVKRINIGDNDALPYYAHFKIIDPR